MTEFKVGEQTLEIDEDGFIQQPDLWNEAVAAALGKTEGVDDLTDDHWKGSTSCASITRSSV